MIFGPRPGPVPGDELPDHYPWPERGPEADRQPWVRAMMVGTLDGAAAGDDGLSGSISSDVDRDVFAAVRRFADAVLVGGGTLSAEGYGPLRATDADAAARRERGQAAAPVLAVVSGSLTLPLDPDGFTASARRPLVFTTASPDADRLAALRERCEVVQSDGDHVDVRWVVDQLRARGLWRIVCEGGPGLLGQAADAGLVDEVDQTISPMLVGTEQTPDAPMLSSAREFELAHVLTAESFLMCRYVRAGAEPGAEGRA
ncbi:dihydrofolate reductase family protein [Nocardioides acrostichi]|nr:dihydrofolate reductase family protein [Nocardioides acrostichi]